LIVIRKKKSPKVREHLRADIAAAGVVKLILSRAEYINKNREKQTDVNALRPIKRAKIRETKKNPRSIKSSFLAELTL